MYILNKEKDIFNDEYRLRAWVDAYKGGNFDSTSLSAMIDAGWYDWFCKDTSLKARFDKLAPKVVAIANSKKVDTENTYVFFKNNCPMSGPLYDSFSICDINTANVLFWVGYVRKGCYGDYRSGWEVNAMVDGEWRQVVEYGTWKQVKEFFEI